MIGIFLAIPFLQTQDDPFGSQFLAMIREAMPPVLPDAILAPGMAFLGLVCALAGAMMSRRGRLSLKPLSTVEVFRRRRQGHKSRHRFRYPVY